MDPIAEDRAPVWLDRALADLRVTIHRTPALAGVLDFRQPNGLQELGRWLERFEARDRRAARLSAALEPVTRAEARAEVARHLRSTLAAEDAHLAEALADRGVALPPGVVAFDPAGVPTDWASLAEVERWHLARCLQACRGNQTDAAKRLEVSRATVNHRVRLNGLPRNPTGSRPHGDRSTAGRPRMLPNGIPSPVATLAEVERWHVARVFAVTRGDRRAMARRLWCSLNQVSRLTRRWDLRPDRPGARVSSGASPFFGGSDDEARPRETDSASADEAGLDPDRCQCPDVG